MVGRAALRDLLSPFDLPWSPLPLGYFVSRTVATRWKRDLSAGASVAELPDQGAPNGVDLGSLGRVELQFDTSEVKPQQC